jgi:rsbT co-antagonist protein RsbR
MVEASDRGLSEASAQALLGMLFDENPDGIFVIDASMKLTINAAGAAIWGRDMTNLTLEDVGKNFIVYDEDGVTPLSLENDPVMGALLRAETHRDRVIYSRENGGIYLSISARPLPGGGAVAVFRNVTESRQLANELERRNVELAAREAENRELISRLRVAVDELSTPVLELWDDVLALPVVGLVDTQRSAAMTERLLAEIVRTRSRWVIVDLTGVELIDTSTADRFLKLARSVQLLGAKCLITGIQPAVGQTLVELGVEFADLETHRNLKSALEESIRADARRKAPLNGARRNGAER